MATVFGRAYHLGM